MISLSLILSIVAILFAGMTAVFAILSYCKVVGMEKSTHQIQWMDPSNPENPTGKDLAEKMGQMYNEY